MHHLRVVLQHLNIKLLFSKKVLAARLIVFAADLDKLICFRAFV